MKRKKIEKRYLHVFVTDFFENSIMSRCVTRNKFSGGGIRESEIPPRGIQKKMGGEGGSQEDGFCGDTDGRGGETIR